MRCCSAASHRPKPSVAGRGVPVLSPPRKTAEPPRKGLQVASCWAGANPARRGVSPQCPYPRAGGRCEKEALPSGMDARKTCSYGPRALAIRALLIAFPGWQRGTCGLGSVWATGRCKSGTPGRCHPPEVARAGVLSCGLIPIGSCVARDRCTVPSPALKGPGSPGDTAASCQA